MGLEKVLRFWERGRQAIPEGIVQITIVPSQSGIVPQSGIPQPRKVPSQSGIVPQPRIVTQPGREELKREWLLFLPARRVQMTTSNVEYGDDKTRLVAAASGGPSNAHSKPKCICFFY